MCFRQSVQWCREGNYFLISYRLDASRHFLAHLFAILNHFWHLNFTDCLGSECFALEFNNSLQALSKPFLFLSQYVPHTLMHITLAKVVSPTPPAKKSLGTFSIYAYITESVWGKRKAEHVTYIVEIFLSYISNTFCFSLTSFFLSSWCSAIWSLLRVWYSEWQTRKQQRCCI